MTYSIFAFSNLEDPELLPARAQHDEPFDFIVDLVRVCFGSAINPIRSKGRDELLPVDQA